jgi:hypothetical protein
MAEHAFDATLSKIDAPVPAIGVIWLERDEITGEYRAGSENLHSGISGVSA